MELDKDLKLTLNGIPKYINGVININYLVECTKGGTLKLPRGMNRYERRIFAKFACNVLKDK